MIYELFEKTLEAAMKVLIISLVLMLTVITGYAQENQMTGKYLIVLDVQQEFTDNFSDTTRIDTFFDSINKAIENTDADKAIYIKQLHLVLNLSLKGFDIDTLSEIEFDKRLLIKGDRVFYKEKGDAFSEKYILEFFKNEGATEIVICGLMAERCVYKTAIGAIENGFKTKIIPDAILGKSDKSKEKKIRKLKKKGVGILEI